MNITFCIKTINRPKCCSRLLDSLTKYYPDLDVIIVDDGEEDLRIKNHYKAFTGKHSVVETEFDIGISAGRNLGVEKVKTEFMFLLDDDVIVDERLNLDVLLTKLLSQNADILAVRVDESSFPEKKLAGKPKLITVDSEQQTMNISLGQHSAVGDLSLCDMGSNAFLAKTEVVREIKWDERLKVFEHWDFYYRAKLLNKVVAVANNHAVKHDHLKEEKDRYISLRYRKRFFSLAMVINGLKRVDYLGNAKFVEA